MAGITREQELLKEFIKEFEAQGGVLEYSDGPCAPAGDPIWTNLGPLILKAHAQLKREGIDVNLSVTEVDYTADEAEDHL